MQVDKNGDGIVEFAEFWDAFKGNSLFRQLMTTKQPKSAADVAPNDEGHE